MMKNLLCYLSIMLSVWGCESRPTVYDFSPVDSLVGSWIDKGYFDGASLMIADSVDNVIFERSFANHSFDKPEYVASAGKWIAAATVATVVDATALDWDSKVKEWLPEFDGDMKGEITLRRLLSHTSGIMPYLPLPSVDTSSVLAVSVADILPLEPVFRAGERFEYGGLAMQVAGRMAEMAAGKDFETIFQESICRPLGMTASHFTPVNTDGGHAPMLAGGLMTTCNDYLRFLEMIFHDGDFRGVRVLKSESVAEMQADQVGDAIVQPGEYVSVAWGNDFNGIYGLGEWREAVDENGHAYRISSPGWAGAYPWIDKCAGVYGFFNTHVCGASRREDGFFSFTSPAEIAKLTTAAVCGK